MALKHDTRAARKLLVALRQVRRTWRSDLPPLMFLTDPNRIRDPVAIAAALPPYSGVILRHFGLVDQIALAAPLAEICRAKSHTFLIANDPELARRVDADGVHWPERNLANARKWTGKFAIQTSSAHSRRAIWRAYQAGMDAAFVSAIFPSNSPSAGAALGSARFRNLARQSQLPLYALGGVNAKTALRIAGHGGFAAIKGVTEVYARPCA